MTIGWRRFALLLLGDRLVAAALRRAGATAFVVEAEHPAAALRAELEQRRLAPRTVALALPRAAVTVKPIELPAVTGELRDMVRFELERHLPYATEDTPFDFVPLPAEQGADPAARRVLIAAADRRLVDRALRAAEDARLRPVSITVAAHDLLALARRPRRGRIVWVHRVGDGAELLFLDRGALVLSRAVSDADDAAVAAEVRRSFPVVRWTACDVVWLSGDATAGTEAALAALGAVVEPPYTAQARLWLGRIAEGPRGPLELALAVAAAPRARPLDLLPPPLRPRRLTRPQLVTAAAAGLTLALGVGALLMAGYRETRYLRALDGRIARLEPEVRAVEQVLKELERKRALLATIDSVEASSLRPLPVLRELTELLPNDAWVTTISLDPKGVELTGQAAAAAALIPLLENSPRFERVEFASPVTRGRDREQFRIRAAWEGGPGAPALARAGAPAAVGTPAVAAPPRPPRPPVPPPPGAPR